jgi:Protein of unknown function (DUF4232)
VLAILLAVGFVAAAPAGAGSASVHACRASDLKLSRGPSAAAAFHYRQTVRLRNVTPSTCAMSGWFTVQLLNAHGHVLASQERRITQDYFGLSPKPKVRAKAGKGASFAIDTVAPATSCPFSKAVSVTPPGGHGSKRLALAVLACAHFSVLPVQPDNRAIHP